MKKVLVSVSLACLLIATVLAGCSPAAEKPASSPAPQPAPKPTTETIKDTTPKFTIPTEPYYVLIIGNDSRNNTIEAKKTDDPGRADTTMVMRIDPTTYQISLLTIPRDTPIELDGKTAKINIVYKQEGGDGYRKTVSEFTGIDIPYYVDLSMTSFIDFYNEIGGVDVYVPKDMSFKDITTGERIYLTAGDQHLNGNEALILSRVRKVFQWGDPIRQQNSRHMIESTILASAKDPALAAENLDILLKHADTNWPIEELSLQVADFCKHADEITFQEGNGPFEGDMREDPKDWFCYEEPETWAALIDVFCSGGDPSTVVALPPAD